MSERRAGASDAWPQAGHEPPRAPVFRTPNAEKYVLEADAMRRRQLRSALLHGSTRTWREHRRVWPAVVAGIIVAAIIVAALGVTGAFRQQQENREEEEREMQGSDMLLDSNFAGGWSSAARPV